MEYKVFVRLFVPEIEDSYEAFIPINKTVGEITVLFNQLVSNLSGIYPQDKNIILYNRRTGVPYDRNLLIRDTDIRNGTELTMIS